MIITKQYEQQHCYYIECDCCHQNKFIQCTIYHSNKVVQQWCDECNYIYTQLGWLEL